MIRVLLIDDHQLIIEGIKLMFLEFDDMKIVGHASNGKEGLDLIQELKPDVLLLDINMPNMNGVEICKTAGQAYPEMEIIALTMLQDLSMIKLMMKNGASGYLVKNSTSKEVREAIYGVMKGEVVIGADLKEMLFESKKKNQFHGFPYPKLTRREKEIVHLILDEKTTQEISDQLFISFGTVETHRRNIMIKLGSKNTAGLVKTVLEYELLDK